MNTDEAVKEAVRRCLDPGIPSLKDAIQPVLEGLVKELEKKIEEQRIEIECQAAREVKLIDKWSAAQSQVEDLQAEIEQLKNKKCPHELAEEFMGVCKAHKIADCRTCAEKPEGA
jgi:hypothetical protein